MRRLLVAALLLVATPAFAIDGQVLINQSTVLASGGFPYRITQPGSYKLTGNLSVLNQSAIVIAVNRVSIDLNGFTIQCSTDENLAFSNWGCIWDGVAVVGEDREDATVRNGSIVVNATGSPVGFVASIAAIGLGFTGRVIVEDMRLEVEIPFPTFTIAPEGLRTGVWSRIQRNITSGSGGGFFVACPSIVVQNINMGINGGASGTGCVYVDNIGDNLGVPILQ
jgi:hypothetical protein